MEHISHDRPLSTFNNQLLKYVIDAKTGFLMNRKFSALAVKRKYISYRYIYIYLYMH